MRDFLVIAVVTALLCTLAIAAARAIDAATDPAGPACEQAIAAGYYTAELYGQCLDDWHDSQDTP